MAKRRNKMAFEKRRREQKKRQKRAEKLERKHQRGAGPGGGEYGEAPPDDVLVEVDPETGEPMEPAPGEERPEGAGAGEAPAEGEAKGGADPDTRA